MPILKLDRIKTCKTKGCNSLGICEDFKCETHTVCNGMQRTDPNKYNSPIGIELEMECPTGSIYDKVRRLTYNSASDGSLSYRGAELKIINEGAKAGRIAAHLAKVCSNLGCYATSSCGKHVHLDMRKVINRDRLWREKIKDILLKVQPEIRQLFPSRLRTSYARSITEGYSWSRMCWATPSPRFNTLEFRVHEGTLNPDVIIAWSKVCHKYKNIITDMFEGNTSSLTDKLQKGKFRTLFQKNTVARHYLDFRYSIREQRNHYELINNYRLPI